MQTDHVYLYESIAEKLADAISRGTFTAGERMPSVRLLAKQHNVSMGTATQVYHHLEGRGLLTTRLRSGYFVRTPLIEADTEPAASKPQDEPNLPINMHIGLQLFRMLSEPGLLTLGVTADPSPDLIPSKAMGRILAGVARRAANLAAVYGHPLAMWIYACRLHAA